MQAIAQLKARNFQIAQNTLKPLCPGNPQDAAKRSKKKPKDIPCLLRVCAESEIRSLNPPDKTSLLYWTAADIARLGDSLPVAKALYEVAIDRYEPEPENWYWLGIVERDLGNLSASNTALRRTLLLRPNDRDSLYWIATNLMDEHKFDESATILSSLLDRYPKDGSVWYRQGQLFQHMGECPKALESWEKARALGVDKNKIQARIEECSQPKMPKQDEH